MNKSSLFTFALLASASFWTSCTKTEAPTEPNDIASQISTATRGAYIVNEGQFLKGNGSLSFLNLENGRLVNNLTEDANGSSLGDVAQSMTLNGNQAWVAVNNSNKIGVYNATSLKELTTITATSPRFSATDGSRVFVTQWVDDKVRVFNASTFAEEGAWATGGTGPEAIWLDGANLWVANSGGFGVDNKVAILEPSTGAITKNITVKDGPTQIVATSDRVYILCRGDYGPSFATTDDDTEPYIIVLDRISGNVISQHKIGQKGDHPMKMALDVKNGRIYVAGNQVEIFDLDNLAIRSTPFLTKYVYGIAVEASSGNVLVCDAGNFSARGSVEVYNSSAQLLNSFKVGVAPSGIVFKN